MAEDTTTKPKLEHAQTHEFNVAGFHTTPRCNYCKNWIVPSLTACVTGHCGKGLGRDNPIFGHKTTMYNDVCGLFVGTPFFDSLDKEVDTTYPLNKPCLPS